MSKSKISLVNSEEEVICITKNDSCPPPWSASSKSVPAAMKIVLRYMMMALTPPNCWIAMSISMIINGLR